MKTNEETKTTAIPVSSQTPESEKREGIRWKRLSYKVAIFAGSITAITAVIALFLNQGNSYVTNNEINNNTNNSTQDEKEKAKKDPFLTRSTPKTVSPVKKTFLGIQISGETDYHQFPQKLVAIFIQKGYETKESVANAASGFENFVVAKLVLGDPETRKSVFGAEITDYKLQLTLQFYQGAGKQPCAERNYSQIIQAGKPIQKEEIMREGVAELISKLNNEAPFPLCITGK